MQPIAQRLGLLLAEAVLMVQGLPDDLLVVPVPLFGRKRRQRGFNQSELLARSASATLSRRRAHLRVQLATGVIERQRSTESQAGLSPHRRRVNVRGAFFVPEPGRVNGRNVLLIDDIYTTGATARACSQVLRRAGAGSVWVAAVARAQKEFIPRPKLSGFEAIANHEVPMEQDIALWEEGCPALTGGMAR